MNAYERAAMAEAELREQRRQEELKKNIRLIIRVQKRRLKGHKEKKVQIYLERVKSNY